MRIFTLTDTHLHPEIDYHAFCNCAHENSGNFYDFIPQEGSRLTVSFGDLPPTGDVPSITIPCLRALVRGLTAGSRGDLDGLARELNGTLYLLGPRDLCAPWFCALVDPVRHELRYVNAGHEPPLLIRNHGGTNHGGTVERLERTGAVLGLSARGPHRQETTAIEAGDILAVFSEGVSDALPGVRLQDVILEHSQTGASGGQPDVAGRGPHVRRHARSGRVPAAAGGGVGGGELGHVRGLTACFSAFVHKVTLADGCPHGPAR